MFRRVFLGTSFCVLSALAIGCGPKPDAAKPGRGPAKSGAAVEGHAAHGSGPHGGTITDWGGGKYHVEFTVDHGKKETTVYVLGSDEKTPAPIKAEKISLSINEPAIQIELLASPQAGDPAETSSRFVGMHDSLGNVQEFAGTLTGEVEGTPYSGDFQEEAEGSGHKH